MYNKDKVSAITLQKLTPELDAEDKKNLGKEIKFYEEIDWGRFWSKINDVSIYDLVIRNQNDALRKAFLSNNKISLIQLISTPDFQLG